MTEWWKFPKRDEPEPQQPAPRRPGEMPADFKSTFIRFAKENGMIPPWITEDQVRISAVAVGPDGNPGHFVHVEGEYPDGQDGDYEGTWHPGEPLPHTSWDDPPYMTTSAEWRDRLIDAARHAEDLDDFATAVKFSLGQDLVKSHGVPVDVAVDGCQIFAEKIYAEYGHAQPG